MVHRVSSDALYVGKVLLAGRKTIAISGCRHVNKIYLLETIVSNS